MNEASDKPVLMVVDASVVIKWQLADEEYVKQAVALRDDFYYEGRIKALAPHLLIFELINGVATAVRNRRVDFQLAAEAVDNLMAFGVEVRDIEVQKVLGFALDYNIAAYDAAYLALADQEKCEFWTADRRLYSSVNKRAQWVRWIGDYCREP